MAIFDRNIDITRNIRIIEWLKSEILADIASLFRLLVDGIKEEIHEELADILSNLILMLYLLGKRLGVSYNTVDMKMRSRIRLGLIESYDMERDFGDLSELSRHLDSSRSGDEE